MYNFTQNLKQVLIAVDQLAFCVIGLLISIFNHKVRVYADLTISAQAYRLSERGYWYGKVMRACIDMLFLPFEKNHCKEAYISECLGSHLPDDITK